MKKILFAVLTVLVFTNVWANGQKEVDSTPTAFEGVWCVKGTDPDTGEMVLIQYTFTGNKFELNYYDDISGIERFTGTGLFTYNKNEITLISDDGKKEKVKYLNLGDYAFDFPSSGFHFIKQPYFDFAFNLIDNVNGQRDNFPVNQTELNSIQGAWQAKNARYTFSNNQFTLLDRRNGKVTTGIVKINDGMLMMVTSNDELFGVWFYELRPDNTIYLTEIYGHKDSFFGSFKKQ